MLCQSCCHVLTTSRSWDFCLSVSATYGLSGCNQNRSRQPSGHLQRTAMSLACQQAAASPLRPHRCVHLQTSGKTCTTLHSWDALRASAQPATGSGTMSLTGPRSRWSASSRASAASERAGSRWALHSIPALDQFVEDFSRHMQAHKGTELGAFLLGCMLALTYSMTVAACV